MTWNLLGMVVGGMFLVIVAYYAVRAGTLAFYRSKREHLKEVMDMMDKKGEQGGTTRR
jgi:hypothetical protein